MASKVHCYVRVSTDQQTLEQQREAITAAYPAGTELVWLEEKASGWDGPRPEYELLKKLIGKGWVKELCVVSVSRLGRNTREALVFVGLCQDRNIRLRVLSEGLDFSGPMGLALFALFSALAQMESDNKSLRTRAKLAWKRENEGWQCHGSPPDCVAEKVKQRADEIYVMIDAGKSQSYIASMLNLSEHTVGKVVKLRGQPLLTRKEYAYCFPDWSKYPPGERHKLPRVKDHVDLVLAKMAEMRQRK